MSSRWVMEKFRAEQDGTLSDVLQVVTVYPEGTNRKVVDRECKGLTARTELLIKTKEGFRFNNSRRKNSC